MTDYDAEALRRVAAILRYFSAPYLASADWLPYFPTAQDGVYCSYFPNNATALFLFIERYGRNVSGVQLVLPGSQFGGFQFYDAYHGQIIVPKSKDGEVSISFDIEANGYGAVFATTHLTPSLKSFLTNMSDMTQRPLESYSTAWAPLPQTFTARPATPLASSTPEGMVRIQGGDYRFINEGVMIEGSDLPGIDVQVCLPSSSVVNVADLCTSILVSHIPAVITT